MKYRTRVEVQWSLVFATFCVSVIWLYSRCHAAKSHASPPKLRAQVQPSSGRHGILSYSKADVEQFVAEDTEYRGSHFDFAASGGATDISRVISTMAIKEWTRGKFFDRVLLINEGDMGNPYLTGKAGETHETQYKVSHGTVTGDLHHLAEELPNENYDMIYVPQSLEHCHTPQVAIENVYALLKPGGTTIWTVPFITRPHMTPIFFQTFSAHALEYLFGATGFSTVNVRCWGNPEYVQHVLLDRIWPKVHDMSDFSTPGPNRYAQCIVFATK